MSRLTSLALFAAVIAATAAAQSTSGDARIAFSVSGDPVTIKVSGRITDARDSKPIAGAAVSGHILVGLYGTDFARMPRCQSTSDADGGYDLVFTTVLTTSGSGAGRDTACVYASAPGYETKIVRAGSPVGPGATVLANVDLALDQGFRIHGRVTDKEGRGVSGAVLRPGGDSHADWNYFASFGEASTDASGAFEAWIPKAQSLDYAPKWVKASKDGVGFAFAADLGRGDLGTLVLDGATLAGRVVDGDGRGVASCQVIARHRGAFEYDAATKTGTDGTYRFTGAPAARMIRAFQTALGARAGEGDDARVTVFAQSDPHASLEDSPHYRLVLDGESVQGPQIVLGASGGISGVLKPATNAFSLQGVLVRLADAGPQAETGVADSKGRFHLSVIPSPGKHTLVACFPWDARSEKGIGSVEFDASPGGRVGPVELPVAALIEIKARYVDRIGNPLEGVQSLAAADPILRLSGDSTRGTISDGDGWSTIYVRPGVAQYVMGSDARGRGLVESECVKVATVPAASAGSVKVTMVPLAAVKGRVVTADGAPVASASLRCLLDYADGTRAQFRVVTDEAGRFLTRGGDTPIEIRPGIASLTVKSDDTGLSGAISGQVVLVSGEVKDLQDVTIRPAVHPAPR